jgi:hypothetical protein
MKKLGLIITAILIAGSISAQINIGANFVFAFPYGDFGDVAGTSVGGSVEANFFLNEKFALGPEVGFDFFGNNKDYDFDVDFQIIPISVKVEYYFNTKTFQPFVGLGLGYYIAKGEVNIDTGDGLDFHIDGFGMSPRVGVIYDVNEGIGIVFNGQFNFLFGQEFDNDVYRELLDPFNSTNYFNLTLGLRFKIAN